MRKAAIMNRQILHDIMLSIGLFFFIYQLLFRIISIPQDAYFHSSFILDTLFTPIIALSLVILAVISILNFRPQQTFYRRLDWQTMERGFALRFLIFFICLIVAWKFSSYHYNYYLNQSHLLERIIILVLAACVLLHPLFVPLFTGFSIVVIKQLTIPENLFSYSWTDKSLVFAVLIMFTAYLITRFFTKAKSSLLIYLLLCVIGGYYFTPGVSKLGFGDYPWHWLANNRLDHLFVNSYTNGWLSFLDESTILAIAKIINVLNFPLQAIALVIELSGLFILVHKNFTRLAMLGYISLHIGIVISSGIFFWKWILLDILIFGFLIGQRGDWLNLLYTRKMVLLSLVIIAFSRILFGAIPLGWLDSGLNRTYIIEAVTIDEEIYAISPTFMAPFDIIFSQERFYFLNDEPILVGTYGATFTSDLQYILEEVNNLAEIDDLRDQYGTNRYNYQRQQAFDDFMQRVFANINQVDKREKPLFLPSAFPHIITTTSNTYNMQAPIERINIYDRLTFYHDEKIEYGSRRLVHTIDIQAPKN